MEIEEYQFYRNQLRKAKGEGANSVAVSVEFLNEILNKPDHLKAVKEAYEAYLKSR